MPATSDTTHGLIAVLSAVIGNLIVAFLKLFGFILSGSGSLFSEFIHSVADTMNQVLLMIGIKKSKKNPDNNFEYGYGKERFFWAILSACGIFFIGSGITIYHGIEGFISPKEIDRTTFSYTYIILFLSFIIESLTLFIAIKSIFKKEFGLIESIKKSDNASKAVILEDGVAVFGIIIAFLSIFLTNITGKEYFDSIGSIIIGILLGVVALVLILENKDYLLGFSIDEDVKEELIEIIESYPIIEKIIDFKSVILDIDSYVIKVEAEFNGSSLMREINKNGFFRDEYDYIKEDYNEFLKFCVDYADRLPRLIGKEIDRIEKDIQLKYPFIKHIDIELN